jgi:hypothetical protein
MPTSKTRYFVMHLNAVDETGNQGVLLQIQILDAKGRVREVGYASAMAPELMIGDYHVPQAVLEAARSLAVGTGDYVDETGTSMHPVLWVPRVPGD